MNKRTTLTVFLLALFTRLLANWRPLIHPELAWCPDATGYHQLAAALLQGQFPSLFRTPGYPLFLALTGATDSEHVVVALIVQMLLDSLTAVLLMAIAWRLFQRASAALLAGLFYAFCPVMIALCGYIVSEPLAIFLITSAIWLMLTADSRLSLAGQALLWFAATMTRPSYALLPTLTSFFFLLRPHWSVRLKQQITMLLVYGTLTGGWIGFNYQRAGVPLLSSNPDVSFYIYDTAAVRLVDRLSLRGYAQLALLNPSEFDRLLAEEQQAYARASAFNPHSTHQDLWFSKDDPALFRPLRAEALQMTSGRFLTLTGIHLTGALQTLRPKWNSANAFFRLLDSLRLLLLLAAIALLIRQRQWWLVTFLAAWTLYAILPPGPVGAWRFRSLAEPVFTLTLAATPLLVGQLFSQGFMTRQFNSADHRELQTTID